MILATLITLNASNVKGMSRKEKSLGTNERCGVLE